MEPREFLEIKDRAAERLFAIPGVHIVGIGSKEVGGRRTGEPSIKICVLKKRPLAEIAESERIPPAIEGVKTDVIEGPRQKRLQSQLQLPGARLSDAERDRLEDKQRYRPVRGGCAIVVKGNSADQYGTLGLLCGVVNDTSRVFAMTAGHVVLDDDHTPPNREKIGQPTGKDKCCKSSSDIIGRTHDAVINEDVDVALVKLDGGTKYLREIHEIGLVERAVELTVADLCDQSYQVKKRGARTGLTGGTISMGHAICEEEMPDGGTRRVTERLLVMGNHLPDDGGDGGFVEMVFAFQGDSGAAVLNDLDQVVGIVVTAGDMFLHMTGVVPIGNILETFASKLPAERRLQLEVLEGSTEGQQFTAPRVALEADDEPVDEPQVEEDMGRTRVGRWYTELYLRHREEIERLVEGNKHVAAVWHRRGGAGLVHSLARVLREPDRRVPAEIDGRSLADCIEGFARALLRFGSPTLRQDLAAVRPTLPDIAGLSYGEILSALAAADRAFQPAPAA